MSAAAAPSIEPHHMELPTTAGGLLEATRVATGLTLPEVAVRLHLRPLEVAALERDQYGTWPEAAAVRSVLAAYARLLDLPAGLILEAFDHNSHRTQLRGTPAAVFEPTAQRRSPALRVSALSIAVVVMLVAGGMRWHSGQNAQALIASPPPPTIPARTDAPPNGLSGSAEPAPGNAAADRVGARTTATARRATATTSFQTTKGTKRASI